jgi:transitional endoplasmic reticulum ATPase
MLVKIGVEKNCNERAKSLSGWVPSDLVSLKRELENIGVKSGQNMTDSDFLSAVKNVQPSAVREISVRIPNVKWSDIGGYDSVKEELQEMIEWPIKYREKYQEFGIKPARGVLLYGPPGCSKTMMAKAVANESSCNFISIKGSELFNKYVGESERAVRKLFKRARRASPCVVFFDEIDALAVARKNDSNNSVSDRVIAALLTELDGVDELSDVFVVAATNRPDIVDPAILRPGRFDKLVYVGLPEESARRKIFELNLQGEDLEFDGLVSKSGGFSGSEIAAVCADSKKAAFKEFLFKNTDKFLMTNEHVFTAIDKIKPVATEKLMAFYENFNDGK